MPLMSVMGKSFSENIMEAFVSKRSPAYGSEMGNNTDWKELLEKHSEAEDWLRVDEREDAINALEHVAEIAVTLDERPLNWKWVIISLHNALQGALVCTLSGTAGIGALSTKSATATLEWFEASRSDPDAPYPREWLADPMTLYSHAQQSEYMQEFGGSPLTTTPDQDADVKLLNSLRKGFAHFTPQSWSIETVGLQRIVMTVVTIIETLMLSHPACTYRLTGEQTEGIKSAIVTLKERFSTGS